MLHFTPAHVAFRRRCRDFAMTHIAPYAAAWETSRALPRELYRSFGRSGFAGARVPAAFGGSDGDILHAAILAEEIMRCKAASAAVSLLLPSASVCPMLARHAHRDLQEELFPDIVSGDAIVGIAVTEPAGGSDLLNAVRCRVEDAGDDWIVDGDKMFVTNGPIADLVLVLARGAGDMGGLGMTVVACPLHRDGVTLVKRHDTVGLTASPVGWLRFRNYRIPKRYTVGKIGRGYLLVLEAMQEERVLIAVGAVALAAACLRDILASHAATQFASDPIAAELALLAAEIEACRCYCDKVLASIVAGDADHASVSIAKFAVCEKVQRVIERIVELTGSAGAWEAGWPATVACDARGLSVYAGTSETMREQYGMSLLRRIRARSPIPRAAADACTVREGLG